MQFNADRIKIENMRGANFRVLNFFAKFIQEIHLCKIIFLLGLIISLYATKLSTSEGEQWSKLNYHRLPFCW